MVQLVLTNETSHAAPRPATQLESEMASVHDVVAYILHKKGKIVAIKLHKLLYYSQAWSLVWDDCPLFDARIEAWANGPVVPAVYRVHRGNYYVETWPYGDRHALDDDERETVDVVLTKYGGKSSQWLSELTHREKPWIDARRGLGPLDPGDQVITHAAMAEYYNSLVR
jgi:uncharacterized phage-associated protein